MHPIIYDVAVSIDGFIAGPDGDISKFAHEGPVVDDYLERLNGYTVSIMGKSTYEFGYRFGLQPGQNPYSHMQTFVFSKSLTVLANSQIMVCRDPARKMLEKIRATSNGPIYLCGGGSFAGSLLAWGLIDRICLKRAPILLGKGVRLFGKADVSPTMVHIETRQYADGYAFQEFTIAR